MLDNLFIFMYSAKLGWSKVYYAQYTIIPYLIARFIDFMSRWNF